MWEKILLYTCPFILIYIPLLDFVETVFRALHMENIGHLAAYYLQKVFGTESQQSKLYFSKCFVPSSFIA